MIEFWGAHQQPCTMYFFIPKRILRVMLGLVPRRSCRSGFKKLDILTIPSLYIFSLIMFVVINPDNFKCASSLQSIAQDKNHLHLRSVKFSSMQNGVTYS